MCATDSKNFSIEGPDLMYGPAFVHVTDRDGDRPHRHWNVAGLYMADMDAPLSPIEGARWWSVDALPDGPADLAAKIPELVALLASASNA